MGEKVTYTTLAGQGEVEFEEKRSVFLGLAVPVSSEGQVQVILQKRRNEMPDATHHVFGYTMKKGVLARYSDDGEPQGTAGMPVLEAIRKSGADDALVIVTRYFGGTLLGAGGLVRAYAHTAHLALEAARIVTYEQYTEMRLSCSYSDYQKYLSQFPHLGVVVDGTDFSDRVVLRLAAKEEQAVALRALVREISAGVDAVEVTGHRFDYR